MINTSGQNCGSRLPCGLCLITNRPCPFTQTVVQPTWQFDPGPTCSSQSQTTQGQYEYINECGEGGADSGAQV